MATKTTRSQKAFIDAFLNLFREKDLEDISLKEVIDLSGFSRGAFYRYFYDKYDLLECIAKLEEEFILEHMTHFVGSYEESAVDEQVSVILFRHILENRSFYDALLENRIPSYSDIRMIDEISEKSSGIVDVVFPEMDEDADTVFFRYICVAEIFDYIRYWKIRDYCFSAEYMAHQTCVFSRGRNYRSIALKEGRNDRTISQIFTKQGY